VVVTGAAGGAKDDVTAEGAGVSGTPACGGATANGELATGGAKTVVPGGGTGWIATTGCGTIFARSGSVIDC
jgi:hypothetical protein